MLQIVLLKAGKLVKLTEVGRLFHALMTLLAKKFILTVQSLRGLYSLYACPLVPVNCENSKISVMFKVTSPNTIL